MNQPLREGLLLETEDGKIRVSCQRCRHILREGDQAWEQGATVKKLPVGMTGPLFADPMIAHMVKPLVLRQLSCPSCGQLLETAVLEGTLD